MASLAALAAVWFSSSGGEAPAPAAAADQPLPPPKKQQQHPSSSSAVPAVTARAVAAATTAAAAAASGPPAAADVLPARLVVDGADSPPLTRLETVLVAAFLTLWCGAPYFLTLLGFCSLFALLAGCLRAAAAGWSLFALAFATRLLPRQPRCPWPALRRGRLLSLVRRYFEYSVAFERPLDPDRPYLFASYPHGAYPLAQLLGMSCYQASGWHGKQFLGGAASSVFACPLWHHGMRWLGCVPADRETLLRALRDERASVGLAPGGIAEMFFNNGEADAAAGIAPGGGGGGSSGGGGAAAGGGSGGSSGSGSGGGAGGSSKSKSAKKRASAVRRAVSASSLAPPSAEHIVLLERKGFVALAIETGADLVPVYYFGNSQLFGFGPAWLERLARRFRVSLGLLLGQWGLPLPRRVRLMQAVGRPVPVPRCGEDGQPLKRGTAEFARAVDKVHAEYRRELERTFEVFRPIYGGGRAWARRRLVVH